MHGKNGFKATTDHAAIRQFMEERNGHPVVLRGTENDPEGILQIDFEYPSLGLEAISWEEFFDRFDTDNLAFVYAAGLRKKEELEQSFMFVDRARLRSEVELPDNGEAASENIFSSTPAESDPTAEVVE
jgi:hypothetical protein